MSMIYVRESVDLTTFHGRADTKEAHVPRYSIYMYYRVDESSLDAVKSQVYELEAELRARDARSVCVYDTFAASLVPFMPCVSVWPLSDKTQIR